MKQKVATIVGSNGQDGKLIASLLEKNYKIIKFLKKILILHLEVLLKIL